MLFLGSVLPKPESAQKSVGVVAGAAALRQFLQLSHVAPAQDHVVGFKRRDKTGHDIGDMFLPLVDAPAVQTSLSDKMFIGRTLVRQMAELHWLDDAVYDHRRSQAGSAFGL